VDIEYAFPFGVQELEGIAARSDFDLLQHQIHSGKSQAVFDETAPRRRRRSSTKPRRTPSARRSWPNGQARNATAEAANAFLDDLFEGRYIPHVVEPSIGTDRLALALICNAYAEETLADDKGGQDTRVVMRFQSQGHRPDQGRRLPAREEQARAVWQGARSLQSLKKRWNCFWDESGAIGRRYRRQDEIGTPFCVTVDFQTLEDDTVTLRDRDTMQQERISLDALRARLDDLILG
jgi:glycyl-tRNA synthetase